MGDDFQLTASVVSRSNFLYALGQIGGNTVTDQILSFPQKFQVGFNLALPLFFRPLALSAVLGQICERLVFLTFSIKVQANGSVHRILFLTNFSQHTSLKNRLRLISFRGSSFTNAFGFPLHFA